MSAPDQVMIEMLNALVRKHKRKYRRDRKLPPAKAKSAVVGGTGVAYGPSRISAPT